MAATGDITPAHTSTSYGLNYMEKSKSEERYNLYAV